MDSCHTATAWPVLRYAREWIESRYARALSLSLPITSDGEIRGQVVENYFENLLPDSIEIRRRMRTRFSANSMSTFDLLTAVGRDCVGAVQLLPPNVEPTGWNRIDAVQLSEAQVEQVLRNVTAPALGQHDDDLDEGFRISIAGAQEKTALLFMGGKWFRPQGATPTTHILKLPLGLIGGIRADFSDSVENEWLCAQLLRGGRQSDIRFVSARVLAARRDGWPRQELLASSLEWRTLLHDAAIRRALRMANHWPRRKPVISSKSEALHGPERTQSTLQAG